VANHNPSKTVYPGKGPFGILVDYDFADKPYDINIHMIKSYKSIASQLSMPKILCRSVRLFMLTFPDVLPTSKNVSNRSFS
jgi:urea transporter